MRKPKGKLVALLAGAVVVVLVAVAAMFWKDLYCQLFLDPRLVGRWSQTPGDDNRIVISFDRLGDYRHWVRRPPEMRPAFRDIATEGNYRIDGDSIVVTAREIGKTVLTYRIDGDTLTFNPPGSAQSIYHRVPDDS